MRSALLAGGVKITSALKREPVESKRGHCCGRSAGKEITLAPMQVLV
jgi:hypothetical protein